MKETVQPFGRLSRLLLGSLVLPVLVVVAIAASVQQIYEAPVGAAHRVQPATDGFAAASARFE